MPKAKEDSKDRRRISEWLGRNQLGNRLLIGLLITLSLAAFLHFREIRIEIPDQGTVAKRYMVAQVDFDFPDVEATQVHKQEALKDLGLIYRVRQKEIDNRRNQFESELTGQGIWRSELPNTTFEELYNSIQELKDLLITAKFSDIRTLKKMESLGISTDHYYPLGILDHSKNVILPATFWERALQSLSQMDEASARYVVNYFSQFSWGIHQDREATMSLQQAIETSIDSIYTKVYAGGRILSQGEKVGPSHISKLQSMKKALADQRKIWSISTILGSLLLGLIISILGAFYFRMVRPEITKSLQKITLFATIVILTLIFTKLAEYFLLSDRSNLIEIIRFPLFVPFASILVCVLLGVEAAIFTALILSVVMTGSLAIDHTRFLVLNSVTGIVAIICSRSIRRRKEVFSVSFKIWLSCIPVLFAFSFVNNSWWSVALLGDIVGAFASMLLISILIVGILPLLETIFHIMTDITLMEYLDPNSELLRRLSIEAPGTYQHCLVVGSLSEAAAQAIGANGLFCRVSAMYHDIGKLFNPHYFTENQMGGFNIHQLLTPLESTQVIIAHVQEGEALARKYGLPQSFLDIIREHHGTTMVYYFFCKQVEQMGGDVDNVDESQFRYPGPKPRSKESAILMIADTVEAASRSLEDPNEEAIMEMVDRLVSDKAEEGQFDNCRLTFEELGVVKKTITKTLAVTRHLRVKYPEKK